MNYIVSFGSGTSGRFISGILWNLINGVDIEYPLSGVNSFHLNSPWRPSVRYFDPVIVSTNNDGLGNPDITHPDIYIKILNFSKQNTKVRY